MWATFIHSVKYMSLYILDTYMFTYVYLFSLNIQRKLYLFGIHQKSRLISDGFWVPKCKECADLMILWVLKLLILTQINVCDTEINWFRYWSVLHLLGCWGYSLLLHLVCLYLFPVRTSGPRCPLTCCSGTIRDSLLSWSWSMSQVHLSCLVLSL